MWELNGITYTEEEIQEWADELQISFDDYVSKYGLTQTDQSLQIDENKKEEAELTQEVIDSEDTPSALELGAKTVGSALFSDDTESEELFDQEGEGDTLESIGSDKDWEEFDWRKDTWNLLKSTGKSISGKIQSIPSMFNLAMIAIAREIDKAEVGFDLHFDRENVGKSAQEHIERWNEFDNLTTGEKNFIANQIGEVASRSSMGGIISGLAQKGYDNYEVAMEEAEELNNKLTVFDDTIGQAIMKGNIGEAAARATSSAVGSLPYLIEAMVPYVGIPMIWAQESAGAMQESLKKGETLDGHLLGYSAVIGASEAMLEVVTKRIGKGVFNELIGKSDEVIKRSTKEIGVKLAERAGLEGLSESGTLTINNAADSIILGNEKAWDNYFLELVDTFIIGATTGGGVSGPVSGLNVIKNIAGARSINNQLNESNYTNLIDAYKNTNVDTGLIKLSENSFTESFLNFDINKKVKNGTMTTTEGDAIKKNFKYLQGSTNRIKNLNLNDQQKVEAVEKLSRLDVLDKSIKQVDNKALSTPQIEERDRLNEELVSLVLDKDLKFTKEAAKKLGIEVQILDTTTRPEDQKIIDKVFVDEKGKKQSDAGAYDPQTNKIYIDKVVAAKVRNVTVGSHELLHGILANAAKIDNKIIDQFKAQMSPKQIDLINKRLNNYDADYLKNNPDEFITQFSDAIALGEITYNENLFTKLMDVITPILRAVGFSKIKFDTGKDVYNFMREYSKSMKEGKLSKDILAATQTKQTKGPIKFSKTNALNAINQLVPANIKTKKEFDNFIRVEKNALELAKALDPNGVINNYVRQNQSSQKEGDKILDNLRMRMFNFNPAAKRKTGDKVGAESFGEFIFANTKFGKLDAKKDLYKESQETSLEEKPGIVSTLVEDSPTPAQEKSIRSQLRRDLKIDKDLINKVKQAVRKTFGTKLPEIESKEFKQALQKAYRTELKTPIAELLGTRENYKKFLEDNFESIYKALPQDILNKRFRQFVEDTGQREKTAEGKKIFKKRSIDKQEFVDYFLGPDVGTSTKGTRKDALAETLGEIMALDATMEVIKEPKVKAKREAVAKLQDQKVTKVDDVKIAEKINRIPGLKFSITSTKNAAKLLKEPFYNIKTKDNIDKVQESINAFVTSKYYKEGLLNQSMQMLDSGRYGSKENLEYARRILKLIKYGSNKIYAKTTQRQAFGNTLEEISKTATPKTIKAYNDRTEKMFDDFWDSIYDFLNDPQYKGQKLGIYYMLEASTNEPAHPQRLGGEIVAIEEGKGKGLWEHAVQNVFAYNFLFDSALKLNKKEFNQAKKILKANYKVIALNKSTDDKITKAGYKDLMPLQNGKAWDIFKDHWWQRYLNPKVAEIEGGIDVLKMKWLASGENIFQLRDSKGDLTTLNLQKSKLNASKMNNKILPPKYKLAGEFNNLAVLEEMSKLDKEQTKAQMKFSKSQNLNDDFNKILENKTGIAAEKVYSDVKAQVVGANKGRFNFFVPPSAEDFVGLLYKTLGKGKVGDEQMAWYKKNLLDPFARAMDNISRDRIALMNDFKALKKELKIVPKNLKKKLPGEPFTQEQAIRTYIWNKQGMSPEGMSKTDLNELTKFVESKSELVTFAEQLIALQKGDQYPAPKVGWLAGNITTDLIDGINTIKRAKYLEQWQYNVDEIFSKANLNKLEAAYGKGYRTALESMLKRMKTGRNREFTSDSLTGRVTDWLTNSIGAIMFFNTRSAVLQTISAVNFVNFKDNNIFAAGAAFANQPQFWKDFKMLFNSDFLVDRRNGLRLNVNEADIADMAKKGGVRGVISEMLRLGFLPTQIADSFAIASGGSTFYRNRTKKYVKEGMSKVEAEKQAFIDFREIAEESQQSSRPDRISQQQAGPLGRIILAFANTPMQYTRLIKKAASDLKNRRGDVMTNISKIFYYGFAQNILFNSMQQALFAIGFGEDEEDTEKRQEKYVSIVNSMADSILRGAGVGGAIFSVLKNTALKLTKESEKKSPKFQDVLTKEIAQLSPPISSKLSKLRAAGRSYSWNKKEMMEKGFSLDNPAYLAAGQVIAATTNIPLDRAFKKIDNIRKASSSDYEAWARIAMLAGWSDWELGVKKSKSTKIKEKVEKADVLY